MADRVSRRRMLQYSALTGLGVWSAGSRQGRAQGAPNEKLNIAVVGCGGRGRANLNGVAGENIVALCDVDTARAGNAFEVHAKAKVYRDFRKMLDELDKQIDAVVVSTPDHTHAPAALRAMRMGKHCYCEKPMAHTVEEVRLMREAAKEHKLATQLGTQIHAGGNYRRVVELIRAGAIGPVREVFVWVAVAYGGRKRPTDTPPVPPGLDWDLWLGPAPQRPYHPTYVPGDWRHWWDFGCGGLGDFGCHYMDLPYWALGLRHPTRIEASGPPVDADSTSPNLVVKYDFPAQGDQPPVTMTWHDANERPKLWHDKKIPQWGSAVLFVGSEGMLQSDYGRHVLMPEDKFADYQRPEPTIPDSIGHHREWIEACKTGGPTTCNFDYSGALTETVLLGNVAYRTGAKLQWDADRLQATNCPAAAPLIRKAYRKGWEL